MSHVLLTVASYIIAHTSRLVLLLFALRTVALTAVELRRPAYPLSYRRVIARDVGSTLLIAWFIGPGAVWLNNMCLAFRPVWPSAFATLTLGWRIVLYLVMADFGHYWVHRLMHTRWFWRTHKWHHYPTYMYWLAGVRGSLIQGVLTNVPYIFAETLLNFGLPWMAVAVMLKNTVQNDWMHLNVNWGGTWLEWVIVTPRYHHVHHSDDPKHYRANLAPLFPIWDRIFGTYVDPEPVARKLTFGIGERVSFVRLAIGF